MNRLATNEILPLLEKLKAAGYNAPKGDLGRTAGVWRDVLGGVDLLTLRRAVDGYIANGSRYWPKPGEIRELAFSLRRDTPGMERRIEPQTLRGIYIAWEQHHEDGSPCPVCQAVFQKIARERKGYRWNPMEGKKYPRGSTDAPFWGVLHDPRRHQAAQVPHVGLPMMREDEEMYANYGGPRGTSRRDLDAA